MSRHRDHLHKVIIKFVTVAKMLLLSLSPVADLTGITHRCHIVRSGFVHLAFVSPGWNAYPSYLSTFL